MSSHKNELLLQAIWKVTLHSSKEGLTHLWRDHIDRLLSNLCQSCHALFMWPQEKFITNSCKLPFNCSFPSRKAVLHILKNGEYGGRDLTSTFPGKFDCCARQCARALSRDMCSARSEVKFFPSNC